MSADDDRMIVTLTVRELRALIREELQRVIAGRQAERERSYVAVEVLQQHYGVSRATVHSWVHNEGCPHEMRGRILRFKMADVEAWFRGGRKTR